MDGSLKVLEETLLKLEKSFEKFFGAPAAEGAMHWLFLTTLRKVVEQSVHGN